MTQQPPDSRELGYYFALGQVGLEMVAPMVVGIIIDYWRDWTPWATVTGFAIGFLGGMVHLVMMVQRHDAEERRKPPGEAPG